MILIHERMCLGPCTGGRCRMNMHNISHAAGWEMRETEDREVLWGHGRPEEMHLDALLWVWIVFSAWGCKWVWVHWSASKDSAHFLFFSSALFCFGSRVSSLRNFYKALLRKIVSCSFQHLRFKWITLFSPLWKHLLVEFYLLYFFFFNVF